MGDLNLYAFNILKAAKAKLSEEYAYIISNLIHLEHQVDMEQVAVDHFCQKLSEVFQNTSYLLGHDRICLVFIEPLSSKLTVLSSYSSEKIGTNTMTKGYSCYVSPKSTLFQISKTHMRVYSDIDTILASYQGHPQRSIERLAKMGLKSGLTLPLGTFGFFSGYLFFNSTKEGAYDKLSEQDYSTLSLVKLIASNVLYRYLQKSVTADTNILNSIRLCKFGNKFDPENFKNQISSLLKKRFPSRSIAIDLESLKNIDILFNPSSLTYLLLKIFESYDLNHSVSKITFDYSAMESQITVIVEKLSIPFEQLAHLNELGVFVSNKILVKGGNTEISMAVEKCVGQKEYSVE